MNSPLPKQHDNCQAYPAKISRQHGKLTTFAALAVICAAQTTLLACQQKQQRPALTTYPVTGKVIAAGILPVGGCVQFEPEKNGTDYVAQGVIDKEGRFSLQVPFVDRVLPGATEGPHSVRVLLPLKQGGKPVPIAGSFVVRPEPNEFTIQMPSRSGG